MSKEYGGEGGIFASARFMSVCLVVLPVTKDANSRIFHLKTDPNCSRMPRDKVRTKIIRRQREVVGTAGPKEIDKSLLRCMLRAPVLPYLAPPSCLINL